MESVGRVGWISVTVIISLWSSISVDEFTYFLYIFLYVNTYRARSESRGGGGCRCTVHIIPYSICVLCAYFLVIYYGGYWQEVEDKLYLYFLVTWSLCNGELDKSTKNFPFCKQGLFMADLQIVGSWKFLFWKIMLWYVYPNKVNILKSMKRIMFLFNFWMCCIFMNVIDKIYFDTNGLDCF